MNYQNLMVSFITGLVASILFISLYNNFYNVSVGVVKVDELIGSHIEGEGIKDMSTDEVKKKAEQYGTYLDQSIEEVSKEYRVNLFVAPAMVSNAADYTDIIRERVNGKFRNR